MASAKKNMLAAQIIKAEMLGDLERVSKLKAEVESQRDETVQRVPKPRHIESRPSCSESRRAATHDEGSYSKLVSNNRIKKFLGATPSLSQMFIQEKGTNSSDEAKMFMKTAAKFSRDDMETKQFSEEMDDSQLILSRRKRTKQASPDLRSSQSCKTEPEVCDRCVERQSKHMIIDRFEDIFILLSGDRLSPSGTSGAIIRSTRHSFDSFISADETSQSEVENLVDSLRLLWKSQGYRCIMMETYFKNNRNTKFISTGNHFQIHCLPIKEKHYERARMSFKSALQSSGTEWSLNKKLIRTNGRRIQRYLPKGLPYFWVCFDRLDNGFGHVIESEREFPRYFGLEIMSSILDAEFNLTKPTKNEELTKQFERSRDFKLLYSQFKPKVPLTSTVDT